VSAAEQIADLPDGGQLYEPRSLWSVQPLTLNLDGPAQEIPFNRVHFYNGGKYPITINRIAVHGIGYDLRQANALSLKWASAAAVQNGVRLEIGVPFRQHYAKNAVAVGGLAPYPTGQIQTRADVTVQGGGPDYSPSSVWGQSMLRLDHPLYLPQRGSIETSFGSIRSPAGPEVASEPRGYAVWQEEGGLFAGSGRSFEWDVLGQAVTNGGQLTDPVASVPVEGWPYALTPEQFGYGLLPQTLQYWDPSAHFSAKRFNEQESTRGGSTKITDFRVMLDQRGTDDRVANALGNVPMAALAGRIGTRIRTTNGGTKEWWWRPGAPMSLVLDTITPATVYPLPQPITLSTEDSLDIRAFIPAIPGLPQNPEQRTMNIGVSLNGFATIEG
jgi:hypothetical protein